MEVKIVYIRITTVTYPNSFTVLVKERQILMFPVTYMYKYYIEQSTNKHSSSPARLPSSLIRKTTSVLNTIIVTPYYLTLICLL